MPSPDDLKQRLEQQSHRIRKAEKARPTLIGQTVYLGTLGLLFVLPVVGGAYLGNWIDNQIEGYSVRWTVSLILIGVFIGALNVYLFIKE